MNRLGACSIALALFASACAAPTGASSDADGTTASNDSALYGGGKYKLWPGGVVPVCWAAGTNLPARQSEAQSILADTWSKVAQITFVGWGTCGSNTDGVVQVHFKSGTRGFTSPIGYTTGTSNIEFISDDSDVHYRYEVIHEFGHALGFAHEQERPDNWNPDGTAVHCSSLDNGRKADPGAIDYTTYDPSSVMNYCAGWVQNLSALDIAGVRSAYGVRMTSNVAPAAATTPDGVLFFAKDNDGRVYQQRVVLGQAAQHWIELDGNGRTDAAPAAALCGNAPYVFAAVKGLDHNVYINQADLGGRYVGWRTDYVMKTNVAPAVAKTPDGVMFFATRQDGRIFSNRVVLGQAGQGWIEVGGNGQTDAAPAAALVGNHPYIFMAVKGLDGYVYINQADLGGPWVGWRTDYGFKTDVAPAVVPTPDGVLFFAKDLQGRVFSNRVVLGQAGQGWVEVQGGGRTDATPAAALTGNAPYVFALVKGLDGFLYVNQGDLGRPFIGWGRD